MVEIVPYSPKWEASHRIFASKYWAKRRRKVPEYIYWKFRGYPSSDLSGFLLAVQDERVVGQLGLVPCVLNVEGQRLNAQWACDLMVDTSLRGTGIAAALYQRAYQINPVTLGSDPSPAASISMQRAGFKAMIGPWKFIFPFNVGVLGDLKKIKLGFLGYLPNPFLAFFLLWYIIRSRVMKISKVNSDLFRDSIEKKMGEEFVFVEHDHAFTNWRLSRWKEFYPGFDLFKMGAGGYLSIANFGDKTVIGDYGAKNIATYIDIFSKAISHAHSNKSSQIKIVVNNQSLIRVLQWLGWIKFRTRTNIICFSDDESLLKRMVSHKFWYTYLDSDENI